MEEYKSNSHKSRQEKHVEKVVSGGAKVKKKSGIQKFAAAFVQEDMVSIRDSVLNDILIPYTKRTLLDALNNGVRMAFGMENNERDNRSAKVSYRSYYDDNRSNARTQKTRRTGSDLDDIVLDNRGDAEEVLQQMDDLLDRYEAVSIADLYDLVGLKGTYTDNKYGWTDIRGARVVRVSDGYAIRMPRAVPL